MRYVCAPLHAGGAIGALVLFSMGTVVAASHRNADANLTLTPEEQRLVERVTQAVMKELVDGEVLQEQIAIGIQRFVDQQRAAAQARQQQGARERVKNMRPVSIERDHIYGDSDATVSLIEYSDFECPYCKRFHPIAKTLVDGSGGKVNWVYRHFPLSIHDPGAMREALASECAAAQGGNDAFWKYADAIFERTTSNGNGFSASRLVPLAEEIGLDAQEFQDCLENERYKARVEEDVRDGTAIGITGTPGNILLDNETGEVRVIPGAVPLARLEADLKSLLE